MGLYKYEAVDTSGKVVRGVMNASSEHEVSNRLARMGYKLRAVAPSPPADRTAAPRARQSAAISSQPVSVKPVVSLADLARFFRQLAVLVRSGMSVGDALGALVDNTVNRKLRRVSAEMRDMVRSGRRLSEAMAIHPLVFPAHAVGLIWGGEQGGYLDVALDEVASEFERDAADARRASVGWFISNLNLAGLILILPLLMDGGVMKHMVLNLPSQSSGDNMLQPSGQPAIAALVKFYMNGFWKVCVPCFVAWIVGAYVWKWIKRVPVVRRWLDAALLLMPIWGRMHKARARERFLRTLFQQYRAGVAPSAAWAAASMSVRNSEIAARLREVEPVLRGSGSSLAQALAQTGVFLPEDVGMVGSGEKAGAVSEMLERMSGYHANAFSADEARAKMHSWEALILWIIISGGVVAYILVKQMADLYNMFINFQGL